MFKWGLVFGLVSTLIGYAIIAAVIAQRLTQPRRRYPNIEPTAVGLDYEDVWFPARGETLNLAAWHVPSPAATRAVIIVHGLHGCRGKEFSVRSLALLAHLVQSGFTVLALDLRGHGESDPARVTYGIRERRDVLGAVDWLLAHGYAAGTIGVLGLSMGGVAGIGAAGEEPAIGALVIDSAFADFRVMIRAHFQSYSKLPPFFLPGALLVARLLTGEWLAELRPVEQMKALTYRPVLVIHARGDRLVPVAHAQEFALAGNAELRLTDGESHLSSFGADPFAYSSRVAQFFVTALATPVPAVPQMRIAREVGSMLNRFADRTSELTTTERSFRRKGSQ